MMGFSWRAADDLAHTLRSESAMARSEGHVDRRISIEDVFEHVLTLSFAS